MFSARSLVIVVVGVAIIAAFVFGDAHSSTPSVNVEKTNEGLSTASDTLDKEAESIASAPGTGHVPNAETHDFQSEVRKLMKLIINSLYKNKEIFLRELLSNASDALDKMRILSLTDSEALSSSPDLYIRVKSNKDSHTLHIIDTGIGMSKEELISNLGTIAKSGTSEFLSQLSGDQASLAPDLIGQFGVGFYSAFLVSDKVKVTSKKNGHAQCVWESDADNFIVYEDPLGDTLTRGTEITLYLHKEAADYLQQETLENLIKKYSQFVSFPIHLWSSRVESVESETPSDTDANVEEEKKEEQKEKKTIWDWVHINKQKPIWKRDAATITDDEYKSLYQALSVDQAEPLARTHFKAEGDVTFTSVLFIPQRSPGDVFNVNYNYKDKIKLYVHRVFISDAAEELIPKYLGFVIGLVDSDDLPLNVSREMLQQNQLVKVIRKKLIRKIIEMITNLSEEDFQKFWKQYSVHIKLGMIEDHSNRARLAKLLRYHTSKSEDKLVSLAEYVSRMKENQKSIYYLTGRSLKENKASPLVERLLKNGYEVIYMIDPLDEYVLQSFTEYEKKPLQNVAKEGLELDDSELEKSIKETQQKEFGQLLTWLKDNALKGKIEKAELSDRLNESPCALVATKYGWSGNMERIMRAQAHQKGDDLSSDYYANMNKIFEVNPRHPIIKEMNQRIKDDESDEGAKETADLLLYVATLRSGYMIPDSVDFAQKIEKVMRKNLGVDLTEPVESIPTKPDDLSSTQDRTTSDEDADEVTDTPTASKEPSESTEQESTSRSDEDCPTCRRVLHFRETFSTVHHAEDENFEATDEAELDGVDLLGSRKLLAVRPNPPQRQPQTTTPAKKELMKNTKKQNVPVQSKKPKVNPIPKVKTVLTTTPQPTVVKQRKPEPKLPKSDELTLEAFRPILKKKPPPTPKPKVFRLVGTAEDHDCDGILDIYDEDIDNDGLLDRTQDSDWDGELNHVDLDDDNDGIPDVEDEDSNGDGIPDCRADTSDHQFVVRFKRKKRIADSDFDGIPDDLDRDDDDDGIPDLLEDDDGDQIPDFFNLSQKDIEAADDLHELNVHLAKHGWHDHDCDGIPDDLDPDDDNDGYFDNKQDSDRDGILNEWDDDDDNDGIPDYEDPDSNGDGIPDCVVKDTDGDGIPDYIDTDDDNDGIPDLHDPDHPTYNYFKDSDMDGIPDSLDHDDDNDGIPDQNDPDGDGTIDFYQDADKDGVPDSLDDDMDNDGIADHLQDHDCDGIPDLLDPDDDNDGYFDNKQDSDNDGILNEWDDDDDNDGIPDKEDPDSNGDGVIDCQPRDSDGDGIPDHLDDDDDNDGIPDHRDPDSISFLLYKHKQFLDDIPANQHRDRVQSRTSSVGQHSEGIMRPESKLENAEIARNHANLMNVDLGDPNDKDCDGIPDHLDNDLDNDGKIDRTQDSDMDGMLNHVDDDDDNDGIPDHLDPDANGDGIPDCRRDSELHYKLVRSPSGLIKRVLRIRKPTQEEQHLTFMVNEAKRKLLRLQAMLHSPPPRKPLQVAPTAKPAPPHTAKNQQEPREQSVSKFKTNHHKPTIPHPVVTPVAKSKPLPKKMEHNPNNPVPTVKSAVKTVVPKTKTPKSATQQTSRKLATCDLDDGYETGESSDHFIEEPEAQDTFINILDKIHQWVWKPSLFPSAMAATSQTTKKAAPQKAKHDDVWVPPKPSSSGKMKKNEKQLNAKITPEKVKTVQPPDVAKQCARGYCAAPVVKTKQGMQPAVDAHGRSNVKHNVGLKYQKGSKASSEGLSALLESYEDDEDEDGIPDFLEGDSDGDGIADYLEDEDGDGIPDYAEDEDGDGIPDYLDEDSAFFRNKLSEDADGDGIPDILEGDSDGDGILDYLEDSDGDGTPDYLEDSDGDGIPDYLDADTENQLRLIKKKGKQGRVSGRDMKRPFSPKHRQQIEDADGDGIPDHLEGDSDGDGIPDYEEDSDGDGIPDYLEDSDGDGIPDYLDEDADTRFSPKTLRNLDELKKRDDSDGDGIPDYLEGDSDGDGTPDYLEDSDGDGIPDYMEDSDGDGIPDYLDEDSALQQSKSIFKVKDKNKNGIPDHLERDSDYDGTPDYLEDTDGDGIPDYLEDSDDDGIPDYLDEDATTQFSPKKVRGRARGKKFADADGDGIPDHLESDTDHNGILDYLEDSDGDNIPDYLEDTDNDGIPDYLDEDATTKFSPKAMRKRRPQRYYADSDGDGIPDHLEEDNDGDGIPDYLEDSDGDGIPDYLEDSDGDGIPDYIDEDATSQFSQRNYRRLKRATHFEDTDGDGIPDHLQGDSDGDGVLDFLEDADGDGTPDYLEDSDGDGIPDYLDEDADSQFSPKHFTDKNRDGIPDALEGDSDGDGIPDYMEDTDGDGIPDYLEDSDGDGIPNYLDNDVVDVETEAVLEGYDADSNNNQIPDYLEDWDGDGIPNYLDDEDGDGIADFLNTKEKRLKRTHSKQRTQKVPNDLDGNGIPDHLEGDSDGDGVLDYKQDKNKNGIPDYLETDRGGAKGESLKTKQNRGQVGKTPKPVSRTSVSDHTGKLKETRKDKAPQSPAATSTNRIKVVDRNRNGIPDHLELEDSDDDGIIDLSDDDDDDDGIPDDEDEDDDGDGTKDYHEDEDQNQKLDILEAKDSDGDGIPDYLDDDDDNDGIPDDEDDDDDGDGVVDAYEDENQNMIPDYLETKDSDGDGIIDLLDTDDDNDGIPDYLDDDDDNDGIPDDEEDENHNNIPDIQELRLRDVKRPPNGTKKFAGKPEQKVSTKPQAEESIEDEDDGEEDEEEDTETESTSGFRDKVRRVLRWIENVVGVETAEN